MKPRQFALIACSGMLLQSGTYAQAASVCVSNVTQLALALDAAQANGENDDIHLVVGDYLLASGSGLEYSAAPGENHRLMLAGGYLPGCTGYASSGSTVLDGQDLTRILTINAVGDVDITGITFRNANAAQYFGGAINLSVTGANVSVYDNAFVANQSAAGGGGALYLYAAQGYASLLNNLFIGNTANGGGAAYLVADSATMYVTGNTIVANQGNTNPAFAGGLDLVGGGTGHFYLTNNILWNNSGNDIYDQWGHVEYANNDIGTMDGFAPLSESNDLSVDPDFDGFLSARPAPQSPLVNAGLDTAPGGIGCCDLSLADRRVGAHVDIGAYESDVLLRDGFGL